MNGMDADYADWARGNTLLARAGKQGMPSAKHLETMHKVWMLLGKFPDILLDVTYGNMSDAIIVKTNSFTFAREVYKLFKFDKIVNMRDQHGGLRWVTDNVIVQFVGGSPGQQPTLQFTQQSDANDFYDAPLGESFDVDEAQRQVEGGPNPYPPVSNEPYIRQVPGDLSEDEPPIDADVQRTIDEADDAHTAMMVDYVRTNRMSDEERIEDTRLQMYKQQFAGTLEEIDNGHLHVTKEQRERLSDIEDMLDNDVLPTVSISELVGEVSIGQTRRPRGNL